MLRSLAAVVAVGCLTAPTGCSRRTPAPANGRVVVAVTLDWEGAMIVPESLDALDILRKTLGDAPITHFMSAAYFTKAEPDPQLVKTLVESVHKGDEVAIHLHGWKSLAVAAKVEPKLAPSFLTGTNKLLEFEDGDTGFDVDLDAYSVTELRALIRTSATLLGQTHLPIAKEFRAGAFLATPKVLQAIREEGYTTDSSATDWHQIGAQKDPFLLGRVKEVWPSLDPLAPPFFPESSKQVLEMPIAATADYVSEPQLVSIFEQARARLAKDPQHNVYLVIGLNQETADDYAKVVDGAIKSVRLRKDLADTLTFTTIEKATALARSQR
jgi:hypothetical protein